MIDLFWCVIDGAPLRVEPGRGTLLMSLPKFARVDVLDKVQALYQNVLTDFYHVEYVENSKRTTQGFVYAGYLEPYKDAFRRNIVTILNGTENPHDAEQYLVWNGKTQYNLCGYFCIAYCTGWAASIEEMLDLAKQKSPSLMARLFSNKNNGLTGPDDLDAILAALGESTPSPRIATLLRDRVSGLVLLTQGRLQDVLDSYRVIYGVRINKRNGRLARSGVLHWVVLNDIVPNEFGGVVELYNPYGNKLEAYEWEQVVESGGAPYGIVIPR